MKNNSDKSSSTLLSFPEDDNHNRRKRSPEIAMSNLPDDLWFQIFLHLPVKDLLASKCVCKSWLANISSRRFVTDHLRRSISSGEDNETLIVHHSVNRAQHGWGPFSLTHLTSGDVLEQLDSPYEGYYSSGYYSSRPISWWIYLLY